mmetsp:Transcript_39520/g.113725  ORF Transcript_39520/g.113725 Transcript_39520/m.113725 type:complete len:244 (-) Transcript_39520:411-1142(-)
MHAEIVSVATHYCSASESMQKTVRPANAGDAAADLTYTPPCGSSLARIARILATTSSSSASAFLTSSLVMAYSLTKLSCTRPCSSTLLRSSSSIWSYCAFFASSYSASALSLSMPASFCSFKIRFLLLSWSSTNFFSLALASSNSFWQPSTSLLSFFTSLTCEPIFPPASLLPASPTNSANLSFDFPSWTLASSALASASSASFSAFDSLCTAAVHSSFVFASLTFDSSILIFILSIPWRNLS